MKRLILTRHAKSALPSDGQADHDRPLNPRGRRNAQAVGNWMRTKAFVPNDILCSDAARTRETLVCLDFSTAAASFTRDLYLAEPEVMQKALSQQTADCILMVAHNPGCAFLASDLVTETPKHDAFDRYPTCATLVVDFDITNWSDLELGTGTVVDFIVPRDITE